MFEFFSKGLTFFEAIRTSVLDACFCVFHVPAVTSRPVLLMRSLVCKCWKTRVLSCSSGHRFTDLRPTDMSWTQEEANQLRALFRKAMQHGIEPVEALGGFPHVDDFELVGTMSDAAKRQSDGQYPVHSKANRKLSMPMPSTSEGADKQDGCYASSAANLPYPSSSELPLPNSSLPPLPPGVINTEQWGRSIINFGKYKGKNISYIELLSSTSEDMRGYVKWCSSRQSTAGGELKDLTSFMRRHEMENSHSALVRGEMIPGTSARRSFKSP